MLAGASAKPVPPLRGCGFWIGEPPPGAHAPGYGTDAPTGLCVTGWYATLAPTRQRRVACPRSARPIKHRVTCPRPRGHVLAIRGARRPMATQVWPCHPTDSQTPLGRHPDRRAEGPQWRSPHGHTSVAMPPHASRTPMDRMNSTPGFGQATENHRDHRADLGRIPSVPSVPSVANPMAGEARPTRRLCRPPLAVIPTGGPKARSGGIGLNSYSIRHPTRGRNDISGVAARC